MMLERYVVATNPDDWGDGPVYDKIADARVAARACKGCVIALQYEFADSELIDDFRSREEAEEKTTV